jgi:hypothetical protein
MLQVIFTVASVLGAIACLSSLLLLWACLESGHPGSLFSRMGLPSIPYAKIITLIYLKVHACTCSSIPPTVLFTAKYSGQQLRAAHLLCACKLATLLRRSPHAHWITPGMMRRCRTQGLA